MKLLLNWILLRCMERWAMAGQLDGCDPRWETISPIRTHYARDRNRCRCFNSTFGKGWFALFHDCTIRYNRPPALMFLSRWKWNTCGIKNRCVIYLYKIYISHLERFFRWLRKCKYLLSQICPSNGLLCSRFSCIKSKTEKTEMVLKNGCY